MPLVRSVRALALGVVFTTLLVPALVWGQHPSAVVGFNGPPIDDEATSQEMFKIPEWSGSTVNYVLANTPGSFDNNAAFRASGFGMEGVAAMNVFFRWVDTNDPDAWVRLTTFGGPERPNPGLDTRGKIRFKILNKSELFQGHVGLCIGIRETGEVVPQLADGGTSGDIEWVGVDPTPNGVIAGADMIVDTTAHANDVQVYAPGTDIGTSGLNLPSGTAVIEPGVDGVLDTVATTNDDEIRFGYFISSDGLRTPIPALIVQVENNFQEFEIDLATGDITHSWDHDNNAGTPYQTTVIAGGIAGMTGNGILDAANDRGTLEHLAFTNVTSDIAVLIDVGIDELQFEATVADPLTPPTVVAPIINDDVLISVTDLLLTADEVDLYRDAVLVETKNIVSTNGVTFDLGTNGAVTGEAFTAIQRDLDSGQTSPESAPVIVLAAPSPYTFSFVLDEDGDGSCSFDPPGGWEHVGVSAVDTAGAFRYPRGVNIFTDNAQWQAIDIALDDPSIVIQWLGGNGTIDPSPTGLYTIDSMWLTLAPGAPTGPNEMFIDTIELLDGSDNVLETIHDMEDGINYLSQVRGQSSTIPTGTALSTLTSFDGLTSHRVEWTYPSATDEAVGLYHNIGFQCGTSPQFSDAGVTIRFHLLARSVPINAEPLPVVVGPIVSLIGGDQTQVRVQHEGTATSLSLYINGAEAAVEGAPTGTETDFSGLTLVAGDSV
ncbi:MAG: hypothetical protein IID40_11920, partial [Planctomycetes bacterium]|nr:hypothetical protein [Planctomycetota bacterium]